MKKHFITYNHLEALCGENSIITNGKHSWSISSQYFSNYPCFSRCEVCSCIYWMLSEQCNNAKYLLYTIWSLELYTRTGDSNNLWKLPSDIVLRCSKSMSSPFTTLIDLVVTVFLHHCCWVLVHLWFFLLLFTQYTVNTFLVGVLTRLNIFLARAVLGHNFTFLLNVLHLVWNFDKTHMNSIS